MNKIVRKFAVGSGIAIAASLSFAGVAQADVTPGSKIVVNAANICSVGSVGTYTDNVTGESYNAALTAGHCGQAGAVITDGTGGNVGQIVQSEFNGASPLNFNSPDYAVIRLDDDVRGNGQAGVGQGNLGFGQVVTKTGQTSGATSGFVIGTTDQEIIATVPAIWGDSGGALDNGANNVGIVSRATILPFIPVTTFQRTDAAMVGANGVFTPGAVG